MMVEYSLEDLAKRDEIVEAKVMDIQSRLGLLHDLVHKVNEQNKQFLVLLLDFPKKQTEQKDILMVEFRLLRERMDALQLKIDQMKEKV